MNYKQSCHGFAKRNKLEYVSSIKYGLEGEFFTDRISSFNFL